MGEPQEPYYLPCQTQSNNLTSRSQSNTCLQSFNSVATGIHQSPPTSPQSLFQTKTPFKIVTNRNQNFKDNTLESPLMSSNEVSAQQKNISILNVQNSHLNEIFRKKEIQSQPTSPTITKPYFNQFYSKNRVQSIHLDRAITSNSSRGQINSIKAFPLSGVEEEERKSLKVQINDLKLAQQMESQRKNQKDNKIHESIQQGYVERLLKSWKSRDTIYNFSEFKNLFHHFAINEVIIENEVPQEEHSEESSQISNSIIEDKEVSSSSSSFQIFQKLQGGNKKVKKMKSESQIKPLPRNSQSMSSLNFIKQQKGQVIQSLSEDVFANFERSSKGNTLNKLKEHKKEELEKDKLLISIIDVLLEMEKDFKKGMEGKYYPKLSFLQEFFQKLLEISNKVCFFLMKKKQKVICIFIQRLLQMITQIFEHQYTYIKAEVHQRVIIEVSDFKQKLDLMNAQNEVLVARIKGMRQEADKDIDVYKQKVKVLEQQQNASTQEIEALKELIGQYSSDSYKESQLDSIHKITKEMQKNYSVLEAQAEKRRDTQKDSLLEMGKFTLKRATTHKQDPNRKGHLLNQDMENSPHNQFNEFSDQASISFAKHYENSEMKASFLFSHPFQFYFQPEMIQLFYDKLVPKLSREKIIGLLESFMDESIAMKTEGNKLHAPANFVQQFSESITVNNRIIYQRKIMSEEKNLFTASVRITEVCLILQNLTSNRRDIGLFYSNIFGIYQNNMLTDQQFSYIISIRKLLKEAVTCLADPTKLTDSHASSLCDDTIFIPQKLVVDSFKKVLSQHPQFNRLEERLQLFFSSRREQVNKKAIYESTNIGNSRFFKESSLILIPHMMEKLQTQNINDVIRSMEHIFDKLDIKKQEKVNYQSFHKLMNNHFQIDIEDQSFQEYFKPFISEENFNYSGFMQKVTHLHVPDGLNEKLTSYYSALQEICNILILTQNQQFFDFKNKLSNALFNTDKSEIFDFSQQEYIFIIIISQYSSIYIYRIEQFFKDYESKKDNPIKYNTKRLFSSSVYQWIFKQNEFQQLYQLFRQNGKVNFSNPEQLNKIYSQQHLISNFNDYMEYIKYIFQFIQIQEKYQIIQNNQELPPPVSIHSLLTQLPFKAQKQKGQQLLSNSMMKLDTQSSSLSVRSVADTFLKKSKFKAEQINMPSRDLDSDSSFIKDQTSQKLNLARPSLFQGK